LAGHQPQQLGGFGQWPAELAPVQHVQDGPGITATPKLWARRR
jgi:hypothetical protein